MTGLPSSQSVRRLTGEEKARCRTWGYVKNLSVFDDTEVNRAEGAAMATKLVCWKCGGVLRGVPRPIRRLSKCPHCRVDLHVCRLCRHYDPTVRGECRHDRAERVTDKESANFCTSYRPRPNAHQPVSKSAEDSARGALESLFGLDEAAADEAKESGSPQESEQERARRKLEGLFGLDEKPSANEQDSD